ncbi:MAG TPA: aspartate ammonia-lyase [Solirubrobacterales bacterium]|jgi:aspartate ammonia-lyase
MTDPSEPSGTGARFRRERDLLGTREVPAEAYWGIHTLRARENFQISGEPIGRRRHLIRGLAAVKRAAAEANRDLGLLGPERAEAILVACEEIRDGALRDQFVVDVLQGGAGTSTNMNLNEVIANRALELLGREKGEYARLHPIDDVNLSQSTNDAYATAIRIALIDAGVALSAAMDRLRGAFAAKSLEFAKAVKLGRTQLQDAVPMTLGQELGTYATMIEEDQRLLAATLGLLHEINLGGTAVGTGIAAPPGYAELARAHLERLTGLPLTTAVDLVEATQDAGAFVQLSGTLKRFAVKLSKICNDLRLLSSGPLGGLGELRLPAVQAGSSIMPGKVNPVIPEVVNQIAFEAIGADLTVTMAAEGGQLQLNAFEPVIYKTIDDSLAHLGAGCDTLAERCVAGLEADLTRLSAAVEGAVTGPVTGLAAYIGYAAATALAEEALTTGRSVQELALEKHILSEEILSRVFGSVSN